MSKLLQMSLLIIVFATAAFGQGEDTKPTKPSWKEKTKAAFKGLWKAVEKKARRRRVPHYGGFGYPIQYYFPSLSGGRISLARGYTGARLSDNEIVYGTQGCVLHCVDLNTRKLRWKATFKKAFSGHTPWVSPKTVVLHTAYGGPFWGLDRQTGALKWTHEPSERYNENRFDLCGNILIYQERPMFGPRKVILTWLVAMDLETGKKLWTKKHRDEYFVGSDILVTKAKNRRSVFDVKTGKRLWDVPKKDRTYAFLELMDYSDDTFAAILYEQVFALLDKKTGKAKLRWQGPGRMYHPMVDDKRLYFLGEDSLYWAYDIKSGLALWSHKIKTNRSYYDHPICIGKDNLIVVDEGPTGDTTNVYALDKETGTVVWSKLMSGSDDYVTVTKELFISSRGVIIDCRNGEILKKLRRVPYHLFVRGRTLVCCTKEGDVSQIEVENCHIRR